MRKEPWDDPKPGSSVKQSTKSTQIQRCEFSPLPNFSEDDVGVQGGLEVGKGFPVGFLLHAHVHHLLGLRLGGLLRTHFHKVIQSFHLVQCFSLKKERDETGPANRKFLEKV